MKKIEDIKKEYEEFQSSKPSKNIDEFLLYVMIGIDDLEEDESYYQKELKDNRLWQLEAKLRNILFFLFQEEEEEYYDYDSEILENVLNLCRYQKGLYEHILEIANEGNYKELKRIVDFSAEYYSKHIDFFESKRDQLDAYMGGFQLYTNHEDNRDVVREFIDFKMKDYAHEKVNRGRQYVKVVRTDG